MNKLVKGSIAGAAGIALLLGGGATLASWNATTTATNGGAINAGTLDIAASTTVVPVWTDQDGDTVTLSSYKIVPGDVLTYTATFDVNAVGDNLTATVGLTGGSIEAGTVGVAADDALAAALGASATFEVDGAAASSIDVDSTTTDLVVTAEITFPMGADGDYNAAKSGSVDLSNFAITLTQD